MKPYKVLLFIIFCLLSLGLIGLIFPKEGINSFVTLKFLDPFTLFELETNKTNEINIDEIVNDSYSKIKKGEISKIEDSLQLYLDFSKTSASAIHYPNNNIDYFNNFFKALDSAKSQKKVIRIVHYGDSQIESDRISGYLRQEFQSIFGGEGVGLVPAIQEIPSQSIRQTFGGNLSRYAIWGPGENRAKHRRYGLMGQIIQVNNSANISLFTTEQAYLNAKSFSKIILIFGNNKGTFKAKLIIDNKTVAEEVLKENSIGTKIFEWKLKQKTEKAKIQINGTAEIYGIALDGQSGVAVDNNPMRGASGTFFSRIDSSLLSEHYKTMNVEMIIMQFGGNMMPVMSSLRVAENYAQKIGNEVKFLKNANPNSCILFIGPSDMSRNRGGKMKTWPLLKEMNQLLKQKVLENNGAYWDMFETMGGENSMPAWVKASPPLASPDYIHFTRRGAQKISEKLFEAIMNDYYAYSLKMKINNISNKKIK